MKLTTTIDVQLGRGQNMREHYKTTARRKTEEKDATATALVEAQGRHRQSADPFCFDGVLMWMQDFGARVTFIRPFEKTKLDSDNLSGSFKYPRDEVARFLGVDDATDRIHWIYTQTKAVQIGSSVKEGRTKASPDYDTRPTVTIEVMPVQDIDPQARRVRELEAQLDRWLTFGRLCFDMSQDHDIVTSTRLLLKGNQ